MGYLTGTRGNNLKLHQRRFNWKLVKKILHQKGCQALESAPQGVVKSPSLEVFKRSLFGALRGKI